MCGPIVALHDDGRLLLSLLVDRMKRVRDDGSAMVDATAIVWSTRSYALRCRAVR
jgi:hypothetical protein